MQTREQLAGRIIVALDYPNASEAKSLLDELAGIPCYMKVGMQLFYAAGPAFIAELKEKGYQVFLDLKMHDIPNTVKGGAASITRMGVDMFNVHAAGGLKMMAAAKEGVDLAMAERDDGNHLNHQNRPLLIAVTQLTSTNQAMLNEEIGIAGSVEQSVIHYAKLAHEAGLDGVVASSQEVVSIKDAVTPSFVTVTPGIRPKGADIGDQARTMTPSEALAAGTDYMVIGRPITGASSPRKALENIIEELMS